MKLLIIFALAVLSYVFVANYPNDNFPTLPSPSPSFPCWIRAFSVLSACAFKSKSSSFLTLSQRNFIKRRKLSDILVNYSPINYSQLLVALVCLIGMLSFKWCILIHQTRFVEFKTPLNILGARSLEEPNLPFDALVLVIIASFLAPELDTHQYHMLAAIFLPTIKFPVVRIKTLSFLSYILPTIVALQIFSIASTQIQSVFCLYLLTFHSLTLAVRCPIWFLLLILLLSSDIEKNPGPKSSREKYFNFMCWNLNSFAKDNFNRKNLLEAHNSIYDYDIISLCETSLTNDMLPNVPVLDGYTFEAANHPSYSAHGGVGIYYKSSLPLIVRNDLSFEETIVAELKFKRKKIFITVLYRSPSFCHSSVEFQTFLKNFEKLSRSIKAEQPYASFYTGDFNARSKFWWPDGNTNKEGTEIEDLFSSLGLSQVISEPTNFTPHCQPSCIDLIATDQKNLILNSGTRPSLDPKCHHQIIHCKINIGIPIPPTSERRIWKYQHANIDAIQRSLCSFPWEQQFTLNNDVDWQVKLFNETLLNVMSNFVPNEIKKINPRVPPWVDKHLKSKLNKKNRLYKNYKKHGYKDADKVRLDLFREECSSDIDKAKNDYLKRLGDKLNDSNTPQKVYWKIVSKVLNKCKTSLIPPLLINNEFITNCKDKATHFNNFFSNQCKIIENGSILPAFFYFTDKRLSDILVHDDRIISLIRSIDPHKSNGPDLISGQMLRICDNSIIVPLKLIFTNILRTGHYPATWKQANVTPVFKKSNKQLVKNYRPISLLPLCGKIFEKIVFQQLYSYLTTNGLITNNQSGFRPGDSTTNQLLFLTNEIHECFEQKNSIELRAVFLDISKAFDKVWHEGLLFKLQQNGINGNLIRFFESYLQNRQQRVVLDGFSSEYTRVSAGVPQGSVLGPLLFLLYINDLETGIKSKIKFFADDTMLYSLVNDPVSSASDLNDDLELIHLWASQWKMQFNPDPTKQAVEVIFSSKRKKAIHPPLSFAGSLVASECSQKHLGLTLHSNFSFKKHIHEKLSKAKKLLGSLKLISRYLPTKTLDSVYKSFVRPHLDYCDVIYHEPSKVGVLGQSLTVTMEEIEKLQYDAALIVTGAWKGSNRSKLYDELGWESFSKTSFHLSVIKSTWIPLLYLLGQVVLTPLIDTTTHSFLMLSKTGICLSLLTKLCHLFLFSKHT